MPLWQQDCESFRRTLRPFILRDVTDPEHLNFVDDFARQYALRAERVDSAVTFYPSALPEKTYVQI